MQAVGYGRTATTWGNNGQLAATLTVASVSATSISWTTGARLLCKDDAGAPIANATNEIVAVASRAGQAGCWDSTATDGGAVGTRVENVTAWIGDIPATRTNLYIINPATGRCVGANSTSDGARLELRTCTGQANQRFERQPNGALVNPATGKCVLPRTPPPRALRWSCGAATAWDTSNSGFRWTGFAGTTRCAPTTTSTATGAMTWSR